MTYRFPIINGDRVALAPHLDLWMSGVRYGNVIQTMVNEENLRMYCVLLPNGRTSVWLSGEDLLGAVNRVPGDPTGNGTSADAFGASPSTAKPQDWHCNKCGATSPSKKGILAHLRDEHQIIVEG